MNHSRTKPICLILIGLGLTISTYLLWRHFLLTGAGGGAGADVCQALFGKSCDALLLSSASNLFGIPVAGWGVTYFTTLAVLIILGHLFGAAFEFETNVTASLLSVVGILAGGLMTGMMLTGAAPFCPLCALTHLVNLLLAFFLFRLSNRSVRDLIQALRAGGSYLITGRAVDPLQARWKLLGLLAVVLVSVAFHQRIQILAQTSRLTARQTFNPRRFVAEYEANPQQDIPVGIDDPIWGATNAPVQIVVFSEFECPACQRFAPALRALVEQNSPKVQVVFKHFPLDKACNPTMKRGLHPKACEVAYAAEAARRQGKFWPFHDELFEAGREKKVSSISSVAESTGLDLQQFEADRFDDATKAKVHADVELAARLGVHATPTLFINRRRVPNIHPDVVKMVIDKLLGGRIH